MISVNNNSRATNFGAIKLTKSSNYADVMKVLNENHFVCGHCTPMMESLTEAAPDVRNKLKPGQVGLVYTGTNDYGVVALTPAEEKVLFHNIKNKADAGATLLLEA